MTKRKKNHTNWRYIILVGLIILFVIYRSYFQIETIGSDFRYFLIVFLTPTVIGIVIIGIIEKDSIKSRLIEAKDFFSKGLLILLFTVQGFLFSYLSFGLIASMIWDNLNKKTADFSSVDFINCKIEKINSGTSKTSPNIYFLLHDKSERISIDNETYGKYFDSKLTDIELQISVRKGIWNYYILDEWKIINNR